MGLLPHIDDTLPDCTCCRCSVFCVRKTHLTNFLFSFWKYHWLTDDSCVYWCVYVGLTRWRIKIILHDYVHLNQSMQVYEYSQDCITLRIGLLLLQWQCKHSPRSFQDLSSWFKNTHCTSWTWAQTSTKAHDYMKKKAYLQTPWYPSSIQYLSQTSLSHLAKPPSKNPVSIYLSSPPKKHATSNNTSKLPTPSVLPCLVSLYVFLITRLLLYLPHTVLDFLNIYPLTLTDK